MSDIALRHPDSGPFSYLPRAASGRSALAALLQTTQAREFHEMEDAFHASGGMPDSEEFTTLLRRRTDQPISLLAHWIVARDVLTVEWESRTLVPLFQFDLSTMRLRLPVTDVFRELAPVLGDWDVALWFAHPNPWLGEVAPVDAIATDARAVFDAARADAFLARG